MSKHVFKITDGRFGLSMVAPVGTDACAVSESAFTAYTCQIADGAINASPNVTQETIPATWCDPEESVPQVGATSYTLDLTFLQDPDLVAGLSRFLFEHDTELAWFYIGMAGDDPPKAFGKVRIVAGTVGCPGRVTLTATVSLPIETKPYICFGNATDSESVGPPDPLNVTSSHLPNAATFTDLTDLKADPTDGDGAYSGPAFTTGQYVVLGDDSQAHYTAGAWSAGAMT